MNPLSAMMETPDLSRSVVRKPEFLVSSTSEIDSTNTENMKPIAPFGMHAIRNFVEL